MKLMSYGTEDLMNGTTVLLNYGTTEPWIYRIMELRNCKLEQWNCETRKLRNYGTTELRNYGTTELRNYGTTELRNYGTTNFTNLEIVKRRLKI